MLSVKMAKFVYETHKQISELKAENASLKSAVEKFTAERSKGQGTANNQSTPFRCPQCGKEHFPKQVYCGECCEGM